MLIERRKCTNDECSKTHRLLPGYAVLPYKHYSAGTIEEVVEGTADEDALLETQYPSESTIQRWCAWAEELLNQMGLEPKFYRGDSKRLLQKELEAIGNAQGRRVVCILDEAHLLEKETLEEFRFLLNSDFDSKSNLALILVGQNELWDNKLRVQAYAAIRQRIDMSIVLGRLDQAEIGKYIRAQLDYSGCMQELFTSDAEEEVYRVSGGIPRMINRVCEKSLMYAAQQQKRLIDGHMVRYVADHEMLQTETLCV